MRLVKARIPLIVIIVLALAGLSWVNRPRPLRPIAAVAGAAAGETRYEAATWNGWYRPGSNKCNQAVADWIEASGRPRPHVPGHLGVVPRDPSAHEWADPRVAIAGWSAPLPREQAVAGDVIAQAHGKVYGHVGIVVAPGRTVSAYGEAQPAGLVVENDWGFRTAPGANGEGANDAAPVVRHRLGQ